MKTMQSLALGAAVAALATSITAEPEKGGTLTVPIITTAFTESFNPYTDNANTVSGLVFEPLAVVNTMQDETHYRLAERYEYADDNQSITYTLRNDLKWSDGEPLNADDLVYTFRLAEEVPMYDMAGVLASGRVTGVTKINDRQVRFDLARADTTIHWDLHTYMPLPKHVWEQADDVETFTNSEAVGSGAVTEINYVRPQQMELCRNPNFFMDGRPYLDCIRYRAFNDNGQIQPALMRDEIDWGSNFIADIDQTYVANDPENHHYWYPANDAIHIYLNTNREPFDNLHFRQAMSVAIDREAIVELAAYGYPTVNDFPGGIGHYFEPFMSDKVQEEHGWLGQYNPDKARELLDDAGYVDANGDGFRNLPDGSELEFDILVVNGWTDWVQTVQMVSEYLEEIGIQANVRAVEWGVYDSSLTESEYDAAINWSLIGANPIQTFNEYFHTSRIGQIWHAGHGIHSERVDELIDNFGTLSSEAEQQATLNELQAFTAENLPFIPVFSNPTWFQYSTSRVAGWPNEEDPYIHPVFYDAGKKAVIFSRLYQQQ